MAAPLAPLSSMVAAKLISSSTKVAANFFSSSTMVATKVKVGGCHQQASFFDNVNIIGNIPTRLLVERSPDLISIPNVYGETPLFTAAGYGEAKIVEFLIRFKPEQCVDDNGHLISIHIKRSEDDLSILGAAIIGQHFETALLLLELDESLHSLKDKNGITALQLLAHMPSAFESGFPMGIFERLIYCCLPVHRKVKLQVESRGQAQKGVGDVESGWERKPRSYLKVLKVVDTIETCSLGFKARRYC